MTSTLWPLLPYCIYPHLDTTVTVHTLIQYTKLICFSKQTVFCSPMSFIKVQNEFKYWDKWDTTGVFVSTEHWAKTDTIHRLTTTLATSKNVLFPGHNHLLTTSADDRSLAGTWAIIKVLGHQHQWLSPGNRTFFRWIVWWLAGGYWLFCAVEVRKSTESMHLLEPARNKQKQILHPEWNKTRGSPEQNPTGIALKW